MTVSQTMRVLHSSTTGKFHIQGVQIVTMQNYLKYKSLDEFSPYAVPYIGNLVS